MIENSPTRLSQTIRLFDTENSLRAYLKKYGITKCPPEAFGLQTDINEFTVAISTDFYDSHGVDRKFLPAIACRVKATYESTNDNPKFDGFVAEYRYIIKNFGTDVLFDYHLKQCALTKKDIRDRINALFSAMPFLHR